MSIASAVLQYLVKGQVLNNVLHFDQPGSWSDAELLTLAQEIETWWKASMREAIAPDVQLVGIRTESVTGVHAGPVDQPVTTDNTGTGDLPLPNNVTLAVGLHTVLGGANFTGRVYLVNPKAERWAATSDTYDNTGIAELLAAFAALRDFAFSITDTFWVVYSRLLGSGSIITDIVINNVLDSQRRRLPGRGS
jgi:hypothetical protein